MFIAVDFSENEVPSDVLELAQEQKESRASSDTGGDVGLEAVPGTRSVAPSGGAGNAGHEPRCGLRLAGRAAGIEKRLARTADSTVVETPAPLPKPRPPGREKGALGREIMKTVTKRPVAGLLLCCKLQVPTARSRPNSKRPVAFLASGFQQG